MTSTQDVSVFRHEPLPHASSHIRLLQIIGLDENRAFPVRCRLSTFALDQVPTYCAISYTWGDPDDTTYILVNEQRMAVRQNCEYVLKQAKWYSNTRRSLAGRRRYFWCDAICINQSDNSEKAHQVSMMGQIFHSAQRVLCCVGTHADGSERVMSILQSRSPYLKAAVASRQARSANLHLPYFLQRAVSTAQHRFHRACIHSWTRGLDKKPAVLSKKKPKPGPKPPFYFDPTWRERIAPRPTFIDPLLAFVARPYFTRVWVYQELCFGSEIVLCCGKDRASLLPLRELLEFSEHLIEVNSIIWRPTIHSPGTELAGHLVEAGATKTRVAGWPEGWLVRHLSRVSRLDCADDRDRVYGLVSLIPWSESSSPIFTDYTRDKFHLGVDVLSRMPHLQATSALVAWSLRLASRPSKALQRARRARDLRVPLLRGCSLPNSEIPPVEQPRQFAHLRGFRLVREAGRFKFERTPHNNAVVQVESPYFDPVGDFEIEDEGSGISRIKVFVPPTTEPGDWCLFVERSRHGRDLPTFFGLEWIVLIARCTEDANERGDASGTRFSIVGKGYASQMTVWGPGSLNTDALLEGQNVFEVYCTVEDALVLAATFVEKVPIIYHPEPLLNRYLATRVCGRPESCYAIRSEDGQHSAYEDSDAQHIAWMAR